MPDVYIDKEATEKAGRDADDDGGTTLVDCWAIAVLVPLDQVEEWLAAYDHESKSSPNAATSRTIARAVLDELRRVTGD